MVASVSTKSSSPVTCTFDVPFALIIPLVTVCPKPRGLPIAKTISPNSRESELPNLAGVRSSASIFNTAVPDLSSVPTTSALYSLPSYNLMIISPAFFTTCLFVMM